MFAKAKQSSTNAIRIQTEFPLASQASDEIRLRGFIRPIFEAMLDGLAGTVDGSFFEVPAWVDKKKPPGHTSQAPHYAQPGWWWDLVTLRYAVYSPNLLWFAIAAFVYLYFPYDMDAAKVWAVDWVMQRVVINLAVVRSRYVETETHVNH